MHFLSWYRYLVDMLAFLSPPPPDLGAPFPGTISGGASRLESGASSRSELNCSPPVVLTEMEPIGVSVEVTK